MQAESQVFLRNIQYTGKENQKWNETALYPSKHKVNRKHTSATVVYSMQIPNPQTSSSEIDTKNSPSPETATRKNLNSQLVTVDYNEVDNTNLLETKEKGYLNVDKFISSRNLNIQSAIYEYVKKITNIKEKRYLDLLWKTIKYQNFSLDINSDLKQDSFPCVIPEKLRIRYKSSTGANAVSFFVIASPLGRLGNVMGEYATLYALGKLYNVSVFLQQKMNDILSSKFPHISMKELPAGFHEEQCTKLSNDGLIYNYSPIEIAAAGLFGKGCFVLKGYPFEIRLFQAVREDIFNEFRFSSQVLQKVDKFLQSVKLNVAEANNVSVESYEPTFISVHARRTDYKKHFKKLFGGQLSDKSYLTKALTLSRLKYPNPIFIATSDDKKYLKENFGSEKDFFITPDEVTPEVDMAMMSSCNHSIFTVGSFGFWGSYLAGGNVYYAEFPRKKPYRFSRKFYQEANLTNFIPLRINDVDDSRR